MKNLIFLATFFLSIGCTTAPIGTPPAVEVPDGYTRIGAIPKKGEAGGNVEVVQTRLKANGIKVTVDGDFGSATASAISEFQKKNGLEGSGVLGEKTLELLKIKVGAPTPQGSTPAPDGPALSWEVGHPERAAWSKTVRATVHEQILKLDSGTGTEAFCPKYKSLSLADKEIFFSELVVRMTKHESGYNPKTVFGEPPPLSVDSIGLLQLSYEDGYSFCDLNRATNSLKDPIKNLECGIRVLGQKISKDGIFTAGHTKATARGGARYWSVLRYLKLNSKTGKWEPRESFNDIKAHTSKLSVCS